MVSKKLSLGIIAGIFWGVLLASTAEAAQNRPILVSSDDTNRVLEYDETTGDFIGEFVTPGSGGLTQPRGLAFGPEGDLYVCSFGTDEVIKYDGKTGDFIEIFVTKQSGLLEKPEKLLFGTDGNLYVTSMGDNSVKLYDGEDGDFIENFVDPDSGELSNPRGMVFDGSGNLYVSSSGDDTVKLYDSDGEFQGNFVASGTPEADDELNGPRGVSFGLDGNLYVVSRRTDNVLRYDSMDGDFFDIFASDDSLDGPVGLVFTVDGNLLVCGELSNQVLKFDGNSGLFLGVFTQGEDLTAPTYMAQAPADDTPPVKVNNTGITVGEGATVTITQNELLYEDAREPSSSVTFTVTDGPSSGQLELNTNSGTAINSFTQAQINEGLLDYVNTGTDNEPADSFDFNVDDGVGNTLPSQSFNITVTLIDNDPPVQVNNSGSTVVEGGKVVITTNNLQYDDEQGPSNITYFVTTLSVEGHLELTSDPDKPISRFTQEDIDESLLIYVNEKLGDKSDIFSFEVGDGLGNILEGQSYNIAITPDPTIDGEEGDENVSNNDNDDQYCWVEVCASGSYLKKALSLLRALRDRLLLHGPFGRFFVKLYYKTSPPIAKYLAGHEAMRTTVQCGLIPVVYGVKYPKASGLALLWLVVSVAAVINSKRK